MNYRFRTGDKGELVLQVMEGTDYGYSPIGYHIDHPKVVWRGATVHDIPVRDPFAPHGPIQGRDND